MPRFSVEISPAYDLPERQPLFLLPYVGFTSGKTKMPLKAREIARLKYDRKMIKYKIREDRKPSKEQTFDDAVYPFINHEISLSERKSVCYTKIGESFWNIKQGCEEFAGKEFTEKVRKEADRIADVLKKEHHRNENEALGNEFKRRLKSLREHIGKETERSRNRLNLWRSMRAIYRKDVDEHIKLYEFDNRVVNAFEAMEQHLPTLASVLS